jgi:hypothetical protein
MAAASKNLIRASAYVLEKAAPTSIMFTPCFVVERLK